MEMTIVIMGVTILGLFITLICLFLKVDYLTFYKKKYFEMESHADRCLENAKEYQKICDKLLAEAQEDQARRMYYLDIIKSCNEGLKYASAYLKPRKRNEMWKRANNFPDFNKNEDKGTLLSTSDLEN